MSANGRATPTPTIIGHLERACDAFEAAWASGGRPAIEDYWSESRPLRDPDSLRELLILELAYRHRAGERPTPEEYRRRFPGHAEAIADAFRDSGAAGAPGARFGGAIPTIPGYTVLGELGRGGMGIVFKARHEPLNRVVALKMILAGDFAGPEATARFLAEAEAVALFHHPNVVQVYSAGEVEGLPFLELEYVAGGSLDRSLNGTPWPAIQAVRLVARIAGAIGEAHRVGIVHRDLKPANILMAADGQPKIADFGLAKALGTDSGLTRTDSILGSPSYMAPEQAEGKARAVGPAADLYSLGAVLYELLTGRPPFRGATVMETLDQVRSAEPVAPGRLVPGLPRDIETIVMTCLQKEPARRYGSAGALAADLRRFLEGMPIAARPVGAIERAVMWGRRRRLAAALVALSSLAVVMLIAVLIATNLTITHQQRLTRAALDERTAALARERQVTYFQRIALAERESSAGLAGRAAQLLEDCPEELRGWEWRYLRRLGRAPSMVLRGHTDQVWDAVISRDGRALASAGFDATARIWDVASGREIRRLLGHEERVYSAAFSGDGRRLVTASADRTARVWDVASGRAIHVLRGHGNNVRCAAFSPDDRLIASGSWDGDIRLWDAETGGLLRVLACGTGWITRIAFSADGRRIAVGGTSTTAEVWDVPAGARLAEYREHREHVVGIAFSPDGRHVASTSGNFLQGEDGEVRIWESDTGKTVRVLHGHHGVVERVAFSPDGDRIATASWDKTVKLWDAATGLEVLTLRGHEDRVMSVSFSPDGNQLATAGPDKTIRIWDAAPMRERQAPEVLALNPGVGRILSLAFSPDGRRFVVGGIQGSNVRDVVTGARCFAMQRGFWAWGAAYRPDGRAFVLAGYSLGFFDAEDGRRLGAASGHKEHPQGLHGTLALAFDPLGRALASADFGNRVVIRHPIDGHELALYDGHTDRVGCLAYSPDGRYLASGGEDRTARIWESSSGRTVRVLAGHAERVTGLAYSPDGATLATSSLDGTIRLWDTADGREVRSIRGVSGSCVAFSPDGRRIASALHGGTVRLWDAASGEEALTMTGHARTVDCLAFSPSGDRLLTGGQDQTARLWDTTR